jgi:CRISPR/Cas system Type II protein with McrA/HNH and RuvC-like nuclease domain
MAKRGGTQRPRKKYIPFRYRLWVRQNYRCPICKRQIRRRYLYTDKLNLDHIVPKSRGGTRDPENLALVHIECNQIKGSDCPCKWYGEWSNGWQTFNHCTPEVHNWKWPIPAMEDAIEGEE